MASPSARAGGAGARLAPEVGGLSDVGAVWHHGPGSPSDVDVTQRAPWDGNGGSALCALCARAPAVRAPAPPQPSYRALHFQARAARLTPHARARPSRVACATQVDLAHQRSCAHLSGIGAAAAPAPPFAKATPVRLPLFCWTRRCAAEAGSALVCAWTLPSRRRFLASPLAHTVRARLPALPSHRSAHGQAAAMSRLVVASSAAAHMTNNGGHGGVCRRRYACPSAGSAREAPARALHAFERAASGLHAAAACACALRCFAAAPAPQLLRWRHTCSVP